LLVDMFPYMAYRYMLDEYQSMYRWGEDITWRETRRKNRYDNEPTHGHKAKHKPTTTPHHSTPHRRTTPNHITPIAIASTTHHTTKNIKTTKKHQQSNCN
jgi:hypothetical protein